MNTVSRITAVMDAVSRMAHTFVITTSACFIGHMYVGEISESMTYTGQVFIWDSTMWYYRLSTDCNCISMMVFIRMTVFYIVIFMAIRLESLCSPAVHGVRTFCGF